MKNSMRIAQEEVFGPVMTIIKFETAEEALREANNSPFGLVGSVYTSNLSTGLSVSQRIRAGVVWVNTYNYIDAAFPWGGFKASGHGRDQGLACLSGFTAPRTTVIRFKQIQ